MDIAASPRAVRQALTRLEKVLRGHGLSEDFCGTAELVLAEVLNNIAEHAFDGHRDGVVDFSVDISAQGLICEIRDDGKAMPGSALPSGALPDLPEDQKALPEGGFGWHLITRLTRDLKYTRQDGLNLLQFRIPRGPVT